MSGYSDDPRDRDYDDRRPPATANRATRDEEDLHRARSGCRSRPSG